MGQQSKKIRIRISQLRKIIREEVNKTLLNESLDSVNTTGRAVVVRDTSETKTAVVYDTAAADGAYKVYADAKKQGRNASLSNLLLIKKAIIGFVQIKKPRGANCRGAWMVSSVVGPGKLVYGLAYALSPSGLIMPDRSNVSQAASDAWSRYATSNPENMLPLDDADHPPTGTNKHHDQHHTEDHLNAAYRSPGGETALLDRLRKKHSDRMLNLSVSNKDSSYMESALLDAGFTKFDETMGHE